MWYLLIIHFREKNCHIYAFIFQGIHKFKYSYNIYFLPLSRSLSCMTCPLRWTVFCLSGSGEHSPFKLELCSFSSSFCFPSSLAVFSSTVVRLDSLPSVSRSSASPSKSSSSWEKLFSQELRSSSLNSGHSCYMEEVFINLILLKYVKQ